MKKLNYLIIKTLVLFVIFLSGNQVVNGQITFLSTPDSNAIVNKQYIYDVEVTANPPAVTFSLTNKLVNMQIDPNTGVITWTPSSSTQGGKVTVKASNSSGDYFQEFYIYVADSLVCPSKINSYWDIDHSSGDTYFESINGYNAVFSGDTAPTVKDGIIGKSLKFSPQGMANTFLQVEDSNQYDWYYDDDFTISLWFKNTAPAFAQQSEVFIGRSMDQGSWWFGWDNSNSFVTAYLKDRSGDDTIAFRNIAITDTLWHHAVLVYEGDNHGVDYIRIYVDSVARTTSKSFNTGRFDGSGFLSIGYWDYFGTNKYPFSGELDDIAVFNRALSAAEIAKIFKNGKMGIPVCPPSNFVPLITSSPVNSVNEGSLYSYKISARDYEGQVLLFSALVKPSWLNLNPATGLLSGTPGNNNVGDTIVSVRVSDGVNTVDQTFSLSVVNVNDAPVITDKAAITTDEDTPVTLTFSHFTVTDPDNIYPDDFTLTVKNGVNYTHAGNTITPAANFNGTILVYFDLSDGQAVISDSIEIAVNPVNDLPVFTSVPVTSASVGSLYTYTITAADADEDDLTFTVSKKPSWLTYNTGTHILTGTPENSNVGADSVVIEVNDGTAGVYQRFAINVVASGINEIAQSNKLIAEIYPVPVRDMLILSFVREIKANVEIIDFTGKIVSVTQFETAVSKANIEMSNMKPGVYFCKVRTADNTQVIKFIKD